MDIRCLIELKGDNIYDYFLSQLINNKELLSS